MSRPSPLLAEPGTIIVLNGTSSAGKTSLAAVLQEALLPVPYLSLGFDVFMAMLPPGSDRRPDSNEILHRTVQGMHRAIRALSDAGSNLIVDHILRCPIHPDERDWVLDLIATLPQDRTYLVAVRCSPAELDRRERERWEPGSRKIGLGRRQYEQIHAGNAYDAEIDTTNRSPQDCAVFLKRVLEGVTPHAVRTMRVERDQSP